MAVNNENSTNCFLHFMLSSRLTFLRRSNIKTITHKFDAEVSIGNNFSTYIISHTLSHIHYLTDIQPYIHCIIQIVHSLHILSYIIQYSLHHKWTHLLGFFIHLLLLVTGTSICHIDNIDCVIQIIYLLLTYIITHHPIFATS